MAIADFVHLKVRSAYSLTEGANKVDTIVSLAKANAMPAVGVTDRNNLFGVVTDASWLAGVFVLGPAVGLSSVVAGVIVSARVNDPRVAQQIGGIIIVPIIAVTLLQATGTLLVGAQGYIAMAAIVFVVSILGLRLGVALFDREAILTRWR